MKATIDSITERGLNRRQVMKALVAFVGAGVVSQELTACHPQTPIPKSLKTQEDKVLVFQEQWSAPKEVIDLGHEIRRVVGKIDQLMLDLLDQLAQALSQPLADPKKKATQLGGILKTLHLQSAQQNRWVEVKGWRLTATEVAAYALCSFELN